MSLRTVLMTFAATAAFTTSAYALPPGGYRDSIRRELGARCSYGDARACYKAREMDANSRARRIKRSYGRPPYPY